MNPLLSRLNPYPFERLRALTQDITPNPDFAPISLGLGEPKHPTPDFIKRVRALPPEEGGGVPAAAMTAHGSREDRDRAMAAGFQRHLAKPFQPADLFALIGDLAGRTVPVAG